MKLHSGRFQLPDVQRHNKKFVNLLLSRSSLSQYYQAYPAQSCVTPPYIYSGKGVTHDCAGMVCLVVLLRELLVSTIFCMVQPYIYASGVKVLMAVRIIKIRGGGARISRRRQTPAL